MLVMGLLCNNCMTIYNFFCRPLCSSAEAKMTVIPDGTLELDLQLMFIHWLHPSAC